MVNWYQWNKGLEPSVMIYWRGDLFTEPPTLAAHSFANKMATKSLDGAHSYPFQFFFLTLVPSLNL